MGSTAVTRESGTHANGLHRCTIAGTGRVRRRNRNPTELESHTVLLLPHVSLPTLVEMVRPSPATSTSARHLKLKPPCLYERNCEEVTRGGNQCYAKAFYRVSSVILGCAECQQMAQCIRVMYFDIIKDKKKAGAKFWAFAASIDSRPTFATRRQGRGRQIFSWP